MSVPHPRTGACEAVGPRPLSATIRTADFEIIEDALEGMPLAGHRLGGGTRSNSRLTAMQLPAMSVAVGEFRFPMVTAGESLAGTFTLALPLADGEGAWNGYELDPRAMWAYAPGAEHYGVGRVTPPFAAVTLPDSEKPESDAVHHTLNSAGLSVRRGCAVARLGRFLALAARAVEQEPIGIGEALSLELELRGYLADALADPHVEEPSRCASSRVVADCVAVADELGPVPTIAGLAASLDVSDRWIRAAFRKEHNVTPSEFFRTKRLHSARRDLMAGSSADTTVTDVAGRWGFWHFGRFSSQYRSFFGELPSATLRQQDLSRRSDSG